MFTFAHYWGIDEFGVFVIPAVIALWALRRAEKRASTRAKDQDQDPDDD